MIIHSPQPWRQFGGDDRHLEGNRAAWQALGKAYEAGKLHAIGVSNATALDVSRTCTTDQQQGAAMQIKRSADDQPIPGPPNWFTGDVEISQFFGAPDPSRLGHAIVTFQPGARTAWHTHPVGQLLLVTDGPAWVAGDDGVRQEVVTGDVVWFEAGERHWHGATTDAPMTHVSVNESVDGSAVEWHEHVSDDDYAG